MLKSGEIYQWVEMNMYDWDDICYECAGYGDNYEESEYGELICRCSTCPNNVDREWEEESTTHPLKVMGL